ncbi:hypothetical protein RB598_003556 [Gaeumannomyces tritici]
MFQHTRGRPIRNQYRPWACFSGVGQSGLPYHCAPIDSHPKNPFTWSLGNGSTLAIDWFEFPCPPRQALNLMGGINSRDPDVYAYEDLGVAVHATAIGAPVGVYGASTSISTAGMDQTVSRLGRAYGSDVLSTTQCVRTMVANPVSCRAEGEFGFDDKGAIFVRSRDGFCSVSNTNGSECSGDIAMISGLCSFPEIRRATILLGARRNYRDILAGTIGEPSANGGNITVTCTVDARDVFRYRNVTLNFRDAEGIAKTNLGRQLSGSTEDCGAFRTEDNVALLAMASIASKQSLSQCAASGFFDAINQFTTDTRRTDQRSRGPPFAFSNSRNALEDVLGLTTALVTTRFNGTPIEVPATATVAVSRVGSGEAFGLVYLVPHLFAAAVLIALMATNMRGNTKVTAAQLKNLPTELLASSAEKRPLI